MNYRHAYHAGNFADVMKHALLARILAHLLKKPAAFRVIDTHAGIGIYDLSGEEASKTEEWRSGVGAMDTPFAPHVEAVLAPWRAALAALRADRGPMAYPGSPGIVRAMLRAQDRAILVESIPGILRRSPRSSGMRRTSRPCISMAGMRSPVSFHRRSGAGSR